MSPVRLFPRFRLVLPECAVEDDIGVTCPYSVPDRLPELRCPGREQFDDFVTYRHAMVLPTPNPALSWANVSLFRR